MNQHEYNITEASIFYELAKPLSTVVHHSIPFLVDYKVEYGNKDSEIVIDIFAGKIPDWITSPKINTLKFIYISPVQNIDCTYYKLKNVFKCSGIKYENITAFKNGYSQELFCIFNTVPTRIINAKYKAIATFDIAKPWNKDFLADVITVDKRINYLLSVCEKKSTLNNRRLFSIAIQDNSHVRVSISCDNASNDYAKITAVISKIPNMDIFEKIMHYMNVLFKIYEESYDSLFTVYVEEYNNAKLMYMFTDSVNLSPREDPTGIKALRREVPELFINNYSRECTVLPIIILGYEAERIGRTERVIQYPKSGKWSKFYKAPDGYFVGLKRNRLVNKKDFPYLVTCYRSDHMRKVNSVTYKYYIGDPVEQYTKIKRDKPIPRSLMVEGFDYYRHKVDNLSFISALETALDTTIDQTTFPYCPQVLKQELYDESDDNIMNIIRESNMIGCGSMLYRYFEELFEVSIHVIVTKNNNFDKLLPRHKSPYIWAPSYGNHIVIFENFRTIYKKVFCSYDVLVDTNNNKIFTEREPIISLLISQKLAVSIRPYPFVININEIINQLIDNNGKCRIVTTLDGQSIDVFTRPFCACALDEPVCFLHSHTQKLNNAKEQMGIQTIDVSKTSNHCLKYFSNSKVFWYWMKTCRPNYINDIPFYESFSDTMDGLRIYQKIIENM